MSWYESTASSSISLCRALLANEPAKLAQVDKILRAHGLDSLLRNESALRGMLNVEEACVELEWLLTFLKNVHERNERLGLLLKRKSITKIPDNAVPNYDKRTQAANSTIAAQRTQRRTELHRREINSHPSSNKSNSGLLNGRVNGRSQSRGSSVALQPVSTGKPRIQFESDRGAKKKQKLRKTASSTTPYDDGVNSNHANYQSITRHDSTSVPADIQRSRRKGRPSLSELRVESVPQAQLVPVPVFASVPVPVTERWCLCHGPSYGEMVACDNERCPIEWYHLKCVNLTSVPKSAWYCPKCKPQIDRAARSLRRRK